MFESLETRRALAGNITVGVLEGSLIVEGDDAANGVAIVGTENPGEVRVTGTPAFDGDVTLLNEQDGPLTFIVTKNVVIRTFAGNDGVELNKLSVMGNLTIETGEGLDRVSVGSSVTAGAPTIAWPPADEYVPGGAIVRTIEPRGWAQPQVIYEPLSETAGSVGITGTLSILTAEDSDYVFLGRVTVLKDIALRTADGEDIFIARTSSARHLDAGMGDAKDLANIAHFTTTGRMTLETGFGNDIISVAASHSLGSAALFAGHGDNHVVIDNSFFSDTLYATSGIDHDYFALRRSVVVGGTTFVTSSGSDRVDVDYSVVRFFSAHTGNGGDAVIVRGSALDGIYAVLGDGDDQLWLIASAVSYSVYVDAGGGGNDLFHLYQRAAGSYTLAGFEHLREGWPWGML
jgi:hypothetical protein